MNPKAFLCTRTHWKLHGGPLHIYMRFPGLSEMPYITIYLCNPSRCSSREALLKTCQQAGCYAKQLFRWQGSGSDTQKCIQSMGKVNFGTGNISWCRIHSYVLGLNGFYDSELLLYWLFSNLGARSLSLEQIVTSTATDASHSSWSFAVVKVLISRQIWSLMVCHKVNHGPVRTKGLGAAIVQNERERNKGLTGWNAANKNFSPQEGTQIVNVLDGSMYSTVLQ